MHSHDSMTVAMLLSCDSFESFFGDVLHLDRDKYLQSYRNDWSWYYARGLLENGIRAVLYIPSLHYEGLYETDTGVSVRFLPLASWYRPMALLRRPMRATRWTLYLHERLNAVAFLTSLNEALAIDRADLLYVQEYWGGRFDHIAFRSPVAICAADHGGLATGVVKLFKRRSFEHASLLYCQSLEECQQVRHYGGLTALHPNGVDTSFFVPLTPAAARSTNIVTVARLNDKHKRISDLIRAMTLLPTKWTLDIVGTGPDREMLETLSNHLGVRSRVNFHGFQNRYQVRSFLQRCGVYAMPSAHEAMCLAVLEAMSCGASVVASRIRTFQSLIADEANGKLFPVGDVGALAGAIEIAWTNRESLGSAAAATVRERFDSTTLSRQLAQSMHSLTGRRLPISTLSYSTR